MTQSQRWTAPRKREVVLRIFRGEPLELLSRELGVELYWLEKWRDATLAAAFLREGHRLLTDDVLTLKELANGFLAYPGIPQIKLCPEIAEALLGEVKGIPMNPYTPKLVIPLPPNLACCDPLPLKALFILNPANPKYQVKKVTIRKMSQRRAFLALIANTFNPWITDSQRLKRQFALSAKLVSSIPVKSLSYPRNLSRLPEVVAAILSNLQR